MADLIAEQGSADALYEYTIAGSVMYEIFLEELEAELNVTGPDPRIEARIAELKAGFKTEQMISEAALCHAGG